MMNLMTLSDEDFDQVQALFTQFHSGYTPFFQNRTKSVAKPAKDYLHGQLFTQQRMNMVQYCLKVPDSEYEAMQHFIIPRRGRIENYSPNSKTMFVTC